jgi:hypothetical protein
MSNPSADPAATPGQPSAIAAVVRQVLANKAFVACFLLLSIIAASFDLATKDIQFTKNPVPLKKALGLMDQSLLRRPIFTLNDDFRSHLYGGRVAPALVDAFSRNGIRLNPEARVEVKNAGQRWQIIGAVAGIRSERTYTVEANSSTGQLDVSAPYLQLGAMEIKPEILDALGTKEYIQWTLLDESRVGEHRPEDYIQLFVTYYTGAADQVPHVPEECYMGGGGYHVKTEMLVDVPVPALGPNQSVQVKMLEFEGGPAVTSGAKIVMYVFNTNGVFCADRNCVRLTLGDPYVRHAYFSKLEVTFGSRDELPAKEDAIEAGKRFLSVVIPVLVNDHWPDWKRVMQEEQLARDQGKSNEK